MSRCRICGRKVTPLASSAINDLCNRLECWKKAHPELFRDGEDMPEEKEAE